MMSCRMIFSGFFFVAFSIRSSTAFITEAEMTSPS